MATPRQKPGRSRQDYQTPPIFLSAVKHRLGIQDFSIDLAASFENAVVPSRYYTSRENSLIQPWVTDGWGWLNPPFKRMEPWVERAWQQSQQGARIAMLVPAAVGANWWRDHVHQKAFVLLLNGRITFVGETQCYIKDCALLLFGPDVGPGYVCWMWMKTAKKAQA